MNERGIALPTAIIALAIMLSLMLALSALTQTEPFIASNQLKTAQARALAEAGVERALWALTTGALANPLPSPVPAPYNGTSFVTLGSVGGFTLQVANNGTVVNERIVTAVGFTPTNSTSDTRPKGIRKIQTTVMKLGLFADPPCALCTGAETPTGTTASLDIGSNVTINASSTSGAVYCSGQTPTSAASTTGTVTTHGIPTFLAPSGGTTVASGVPTSTLSGSLWTDADMAILKSVARQNGTYFQGAVTWTTVSPPPNGIVFVDTVSGNPFTNTTPTTDAGSVTIDGDFTWSGWLIVAGSASIRRAPIMTGLVYTQDDITIDDNTTVTGGVISANRKNSISSNVDSLVGHVTVTYNCPAIRNGGGSVPQSWFVKAGTYREAIAGQ